MPTQSGSIDLNSYKMVNDNASKTATNYIQADSTGIKIANADPATATTYQHQTATKTEFVVNNKVQAEIGGNGATFGNSNSTKLVLDNSSMKLKDSRNNTYISLEDIRDTNSTTYTKDIPIYSTSNGSVNFSLEAPIQSINSIKTVDGNNVTSNYSYSFNNNILTINNYVANTNLLVNVTLTYSVSDIYSAATFGTRNGNKPLGKNSLTIGKNISAEGDNTFSSGYNNSVIGSNASALGSFLKTSSDNQLICGYNNVDDPSMEFIVGIGYGTNYNGKNGFTVSKVGDATIAKDAAVGNDLNVTRDLLVSRNATINGSLTVNTQISCAIQSLTLDTTPILITNSYYTSQEQIFNITVAEIRFAANTVQLYMECNLKSDFNIPLTGSWNNRKIGRIAASNLRPISEVYCMSGGDLPVFIKITTGGDIIATASVVSQDRTNTDYTTYKTTRTMKISATYMTA